MGTDPNSAPRKGANPKAAKSPQTGLIAQTARFAASQIVSLTTFFGAIAGSAYAYRKLPTALGISHPECAALVAAVLALVFFSHTLPTLREKWLRDRLYTITGTSRRGYFQLAPREEKEENTFDRADGMHEEVLRWLRQPPGRVLYLTGSSGCGKSSLLAAWVLPKLQRENVKIIRLRSFQDPAKALEDALKSPDIICWERSPPKTTELNDLLEMACQQVRPARILIVFDQFEEFLIGQEDQQRTRFVKFVTTLGRSKDTSATIMLVFRAEYDEFIRDLNLPTPIPGQNLQKVSAFKERVAQAFLLGSKLKFQEKLLVDVLREAAEVDETKGLIRPITINLCGLVLERFATGLPHSFRPGRLIRGFVHEAIFQKDVREAAPILLPKLISSRATRQQCTIFGLASGTNFSSRQAQGVMFKLSEPERGIVRTLDPDCTVWEISHDFLVPMIDSMLAQWRISAWKRVRPWLPLAYAASLLAVLFAWPLFSPDPIAELNRLGWTTQKADLDIQRAVLPDDSHDTVYLFTIDTIPTPESERVLERVQQPFAVKLEFDEKFDSTLLRGWNHLNNLRMLIFVGNHHHGDFSALKNLPLNLNYLLLTYDDITDEGLKNLPILLGKLMLTNDENITDEGLRNLRKTPALESLSLGDIKGITDAGLKNLPENLNELDLEDEENITDEGLKNLPKFIFDLELISNSRITDEGLMSLPKFLKSLDLRGVSKITDEGLKHFPESLTSLDLYGDNITDEGLKSLPRSLTSLNLDRDSKITDEGLKNLPGSLTSLNLNGDNITDEGLKSLPRSLTSLDLSWDTNITDAGLKSLPGSLKSLVLFRTNITDEGLKNLPRSLTSLNVFGAKVTDEGIKNLPASVRVIDTLPNNNSLEGP